MKDSVAGPPSSPERARLNSGGFGRRSFIPEFEFGSSLLFLFVVLLPIALVGGLCIGYAALVSQPAEYEIGVRADR